MIPIQLRRAGRCSMFCLLLLALQIVGIGPGAHEAESSQADRGADCSLLGSVHNDTLHVSLAKVTAAALAHNEMLAASRAMTDAAAADALGAWRGFLPQLQLGEFYMRSDDPLMSFGFKLNNRSVAPEDFDPTLLNNPGTAKNYITRLQVMQPIFNGGMGLFGKQAADAASRAAVFEHQRAIETVEFQAVQVYAGLALAKSYEEVMLAAVSSADGHVRQAQAMVDAEMATEADLLQALVYRAGLQQRLIEVRNQLAVAGEYLKLLTNIDIELPLVADSDLTTARQDLSLLAPETATVDFRSDLQARSLELTAASKMVGVARGAMLPHVNLAVHWDRFSQQDLFGDEARSYTLGVFGTWDLFKGLQNVSALKKARAQKRAVEHMYKFEAKQAQLQATQACLEAQAAAEKVTVAEETVSAAREGLRIVTNQYREGLASMVDLLDTQAAAIMAEGNLVQAKHDYRVGLAQLDYARGAKTN